MARVTCYSSRGNSLFSIGLWHILDRQSGICRDAGCNTCNQQCAGVRIYRLGCQVGTRCVTGQYRVVRRRRMMTAGER